MNVWILSGLISCATKNTAQEEHPVPVEHTPIEMPKKTPEVEPDPAETEETSEGGIVGGVAGGVIGGAIGGKYTDPEHADDRFQKVHWSEVKIKQQKKPTLPSEAVQLNLKKATCFVRFFIDTEGVPEKVYVQNCPQLFHESVREAAMTWRFYPVEREGKIIKANMMMRVQFQNP